MISTSDKGNDQHKEQWKWSVQGTVEMISTSDSENDREIMLS
jgi:hypothetical protein